MRHFFAVGFVIFWFCCRGSVDNAIEDTAYKPVSSNDIDTEKNIGDNNWEDWGDNDGWSDDKSRPEKTALKALPLSLTNIKKKYVDTNDKDKEKSVRCTTTVNNPSSLNVERSASNESAMSTSDVSSIELDNPSSDSGSSGYVHLNHNNDISLFVSTSYKGTQNPKRGSRGATTTTNTTAPPLQAVDVDYFGEMGISASPFKITDKGKR